jgi:antirestriction protein ArdC
MPYTNEQKAIYFESKENEFAIKLADTFLSLMEKGVTPWEKGYEIGKETPVNGSSMRMYSGLNSMYLYMIRVEREYKYPIWVTFAQAKKLGFSFNTQTPMKGRGVMVQSGFYLHLDENGKKCSQLYYNKHIKKCKRLFKKKNITLFNIHYFLNNEVNKIIKDFGVKLTETPKSATIESGENFLNDYLKTQNLALRFGSPSYCWNKINGEEWVNMPSFDSYRFGERYLKTLAHECIHTTGAKKRLDREINGKMGTESYGKEELCAEMGAYMLMGKMGIDTTKLEQNTAAYLKNWMNAIKADKNILYNAAKLAESAANWINKQVKIQPTNKSNTMAV